MVSVVTQLAFGEEEDALFASLVKSFTAEEIGLVRRAMAFAAPIYTDKLTVTGVPLLRHALGTASILAGMNMDDETVAAAILFAVPENLKDWAEKLRADFGPVIANLVGGVSRVEQIREFGGMGEAHEKERKRGDPAMQAEALRKMLLAMVEDIRVVLIALAERTQTMRSLSKVDLALQQKIARETRGIFAPLANRLGVWQVKWELEDLSLRFLEPELYKKIASLLDEKRTGREQYIEDIKSHLRQELERAGIKAEVTGRPKHITSIVNKMRRKGVDFSDLYDVRAVRILVEDVKDCYAALGLVHNLWQPIPKEFDDYIAHPKSNEYRSLHTAVIGPKNLAVEVQIRTHEMHQHSELGVAAHWRYKEGGKHDAKFNEKIAWLRQILEWKEEIADSGDMVEQFRNELFQDQVYVLTPQGKVIDLPRGATPVDFAYTLHTDLGHRTRGAKVDGNIVPLNTKLQNGQRVEILAAKQGSPSRDWLNPALGYLQSSRARAKVRHWFRYLNYEQNVSDGRAQLDRELHRLGIESVNQEKLAQRLNFNKLEDLLAAIGRGDVTDSQIAQALADEIKPKMEEARPPAPRAASRKAPATGILVEGVGNLLTRPAKCCRPAPPDAIVGYVTHDHGVTIHRKDCAAMLRLPSERRSRLLHAQWGDQSDAAFIVDIEVSAFDRQGLLRDISDVFTREKVNVVRVNTVSRNFQAKMQFSVEIRELGQLTQVLALLNQVSGVMNAVRRV